MKYQKPYYADEEPHFERPFIGAEIGLSLLLKLFAKELKDTESWQRQPSTAQLILERASWLYWHSDEAAEITKRARPFVALFEEAYQKDPAKAMMVYYEIMSSYSEIQHAAYSRDYRPHKGDDFVGIFNRLFDEYRFRYEELLNRLMSIAYGCIEIIVGNSSIDGKRCIDIDANPKLKRLNESLLPSSSSYDKIRVSVAGIRPGIRNALSHGGRRSQVPDKERFLLQDSSGWQQEFTIESFRKELDTLNRTIISLEIAALIINMNHVNDLANREQIHPQEFSQEQKSQILYTAARDCELEMLSGENKPPFLELKVRFKPIRPRESEVFGNWGGVRFKQKVPASPVELKGQVFRFVDIILPVLDAENPGIVVEVYEAYGDAKLARTEIADAAGFDKAVKEKVKGHDDYKSKAEVEKEYVKWERFSWATGEIGPDGKPI